MHPFLEENTYFQHFQNLINKIFICNRFYVSCHSTNRTYYYICECMWILLSSAGFPFVNNMRMENTDISLSVWIY